MTAAGLANPSCCARFLAQVVSDPLPAADFPEGSAAVCSHVPGLPPAAMGRLGDEAAVSRGSGRGHPLA
ncbi:hypothetical protein M8542_19575 [Amycolatopsis sp. OK19-0408]|uniref:Uncharacterized protein n=1 Tax=Amycolatopsis iheyensis TaxID=2945988 RepID=A0A9X2ND08_9PSEU|nr:hypothetical protein [Amycolatopsis iheyensis]MCR6485031.1 hypothetical protein [Amycolatopsis iheyensis]